MISWLTSFFDAYYQNNRIIRIWCRANVFGLLKPGKHEASPQSYLPISLLCSTYELMEHLLLCRINRIIDPIFPNDQASFRQGRSTVETKATNSNDQLDLCDRFYHGITAFKILVFHTSDGQTSKPHRLKNGMVQGSVLASTLYKIYTSDFPAMLATRYMYADNVALKASAHTTSEI